eukprot:GHVR01014966.1.p1 GENE.GHVR01014966.1~~GHVR01014966.1.p1  ORF type:complete len:161 (+),score=0.44 GHVR01014966.1:314-796(+)
MLYNEIPMNYTWNKKEKKWNRRVISTGAIGRVFTVHPNNFECYFLRLLLHTVRGPTSFTFLKTIDEYVCETFRETCNKLGLLKNDTHWDATLLEAAGCASACKIRYLFVIYFYFIVRCHNHVSCGWITENPCHKISYIGNVKLCMILILLILYSIKPFKT